MNTSLSQFRSISMKKILQGLSVAFLFLPGVFGSNLELSVFDCGQGNAVVARFNDETMILDAGSKARTKFVGFAYATGDCSEIDVEFPLLETGDPMWLGVSDPMVPEITEKKEVDKENQWHWESFSAEVFGGKVTDSGKTCYTIPNRSLKSVFVSHPDIDHYSLLRRLIEETPDDSERFKEIPFLLGGKRETYISLVSKIKKLKAEISPCVVCGLEKSVEDFRAKIPSFSAVGATAAAASSAGSEELQPKVEILTVNAVYQKRKKRNRNLDSMVVKASMPGGSFLMPGDAEAGTWDSVKEDAAGLDPLQSDVFLVAHHGADTAVSTSKALLNDRIKPKICLISAGFMHKHPEVGVINILKKYFEGTKYRTYPHFVTYYTSGMVSCAVTNLPIFTTMDNGRINVTFGSDAISLKVARNFLPNSAFSLSDDDGGGLSFVVNHPATVHAKMPGGVTKVAGLAEIFFKSGIGMATDTYFYKYRENVCFEAARQDSTGSELSAEAADTSESE